MIPDYPDPDRPLHADISHPIGGTINLGPSGYTITGPIWVIVVMLVQAIDRSASLTEQQRCDLYLSACDNLLGATHEGTGSTSEKAIHEALSVFAKILGVTNA